MTEQYWRFTRCLDLLKQSDKIVRSLGNHRIVTGKCLGSITVTSRAICINEDFLKDKTDEEICGLIQHEAWHVYAGHLCRREVLFNDIRAGHVLDDSGQAAFATKTGYKWTLLHIFARIAFDLEVSILMEHHRPRYPHAGLELGKGPFAELKSLDILAENFFVRFVNEPAWRQVAMNYLKQEGYQYADYE